MRKFAITPRRGGERPADQRRRWRQAEAGFSLLEMLVVLAIMALLATLVAPRLFNQVDRAKVTSATAQARSIKTSLDTLRLDIGRYPTAEEGLTLLVSPPQDPAARATWFGPYLEGELPNDPWGNPYTYVPPQTDESGFVISPKIKSLGADNRDGGSGADQDIVV